MSYNAPTCVHYSTRRNTVSGEVDIKRRASRGMWANSTATAAVPLSVLLFLLLLL